MINFLQNKQIEEIISQLKSDKNSLYKISEETIVIIC
jgi:hypothetical protein